MKTLVVYRSHYGSTRRYAQWLAQALDADAAEERQADACTFSKNFHTFPG